MFRQLVIVGLAVVFCLISSSKSSPAIQERTDKTGLKWIGPIRKCSAGGDDVLDKCLTKIVQDLTPLVGKGIPELSLQPLDPLFVDEFLYAQNWGPIVFNVSTKSANIYNLPKYKNLKFQVDTKQRVLRFLYENPNVVLDANYLLSGKAFFFPLKGDGPVHIEVFGMKAQGHMNFYKTENENGEKIIQLKDTKIDTMTIKNLRVRIRGLFDGNPMFTAVAHYFGNNFGPQIFEIARPEISEHTGNVLTHRILNPILSKLPFVAEYVPDL